MHKGDDKTLQMKTPRHSKHSEDDTDKDPYPWLVERRNMTDKEMLENTIDLS